MFPSQSFCVAEQEATCSNSDGHVSCGVPFLFLIPLSSTKFLAAATNLFSFTTTGPDKSYTLAKAPSSLWNRFSHSHFQAFPVFLFLSFHLENIRWERLSTLLFPSSISFSSTVSQSFLNTGFYLVYSFLWNLTPFSLPIKPVSALGGVLSIKFCFFLYPF